MNLFKLLLLEQPELLPESCKLHLATDPKDGAQHPLDAFFAGRFERWQSWQGKRNFERPYIVSLIKLGGSRWLFAGAFRRTGRAWETDPGPPHWRYQTEEIQALAPFAGRWIVHHKRSGRASYLNADRWVDSVEVIEMLPKRMSVGDFPGYHHLVLSKPTLDLLVRDQVPSWRAALASVAGVYLITDTSNGQLYVGSATGAGGFWDRWSSYAATGHGGNRDLRKVLKVKGADHSRHWQWSILEIADTHASSDDVLARESHWKRVLGSREHGYNAN